MKTLLHLLLALLVTTGTACSQSISPRDPLTVDRTNKRVNESFNVPSGKFINIETGATLNINGSLAGNPTITAIGEDTALTIESTYGDVSVVPHVYIKVHADWSGTMLKLEHGVASILDVTNTSMTLGPGVAFAADKTITAGGTTGAQTIHKIAGSVNLAASATSLVVTNNKVTTSSVIMLTVGTNDASNFHVRAVAASGSFTIHVVGTAPAAETRVNFWVIN